MGSKSTIQCEYICYSKQWLLSLTV
jgi:hypothetical protein